MVSDFLSAEPVSVASVTQVGAAGLVAAGVGLVVVAPFAGVDAAGALWVTVTVGPGDAAGVSVPPPLAAPIATPTMKTDG
jgi:hypothetical protein